MTKPFTCAQAHIPTFGSKCWFMLCKLAVSAVALEDVPASSLRSQDSHQLPQMYAVQFQLQKEQSVVECRRQSNQSLLPDRKQTCTQNVCRVPAIYIKHNISIKYIHYQQPALTVIPCNLEVLLYVIKT